MRWTLGKRMVLIALAASAPMLAVLFYNESSARYARQKEIHEIAQASAQQAAMEIQRLFVGAENVLKAVAAAPAVKSLDPIRCGPYLTELKSRLPELSVLVVFDLQGNSRCRSDDAATGVNSADRSYFRDAIASPGKMVIGEYTISRTTGRPGLPLALAVPDDKIQPTVVVVAGLDLEWLGGTLSSRALAKDGSLTIADREGVILAREPLPERFVGTKIPAQFLTLVTDRQPGTLEVQSQDGTQRVLGYIPSALPPEGIYISVGISVDEAFREISNGTYRAIIIAILASATSVLIALLFSQRLVQGPVDRIHRVLAARRKGKARARTGMAGEQGDIEALGAEFDRFMDDLQVANAERDVAEERRQIASMELSHRLKNIIATIQSVALQTLKHHAEPEALESFTRRMTSIAQAHNLLLNETATGARLQDAIMAALTSFVELGSHRLHLSGPVVQLKPRAVQCLTMALHELATNAAKYGALSTEEGSISIEWTIVEGAFLMEWHEQGGPAVEAPLRKGFGTRMIERVLAMELNAQVSLQYERSGLKCVIQAPSASTVISP